MVVKRCADGVLLRYSFTGNKGNLAGALMITSGAVATVTGNTFIQNSTPNVRSACSPYTVPNNADGLQYSESVLLITSIETEHRVCTIFEALSHT